MAEIKKSTIVAILAGTIGTLILTGGGVVRLDIAGDSHWMTKTDYTELKTELSFKYFADEEFTYQELQLLTGVLNEEAKNGKFVDIKNATNDNLVGKMIQEAVKIKVENNAL